MSQDVTGSSEAVSGHFVVPGTCFNSNASPLRQREANAARIARDPVLRNFYLGAALADVPRLLGAVDRNPYRPTYGCMDRQFWHYRTSSFPSQMFQEGVLPLALVYSVKLPGNRWQGDLRVRELAVAAMRFAARSSHRDGSCDDYYPFERALGAAVFSLQAAARAYQLLELDDGELLGWFERRAHWLIRHDESGHLANHQALAALGLLRVWQITKTQAYRDAAEARIRTLLDWQSDEGWFEEYGGADPGYQTVTIDCLAKIRRLTGAEQLDEPLRKAVAFARMFLHPDDSYAGQYGSRGTYHFYPHGMELLAADDPNAADLADGFLRGLAAGKQAALSDDRMYAHRLGNLIEAYVDWAPTRPAPSPQPETDSTRYLPQARLLVRRRRTAQTVISAARGGVFKHFAPGRSPVSDAGLIVETADGRAAVSQTHDLERRVEGISNGEAAETKTFSVSGPLYWTRFETATPIKQAVFHTGMLLAGRWCRTLVRRLLQRRLITGRRACPVRLTRTFEFLGEREAGGGPVLRVTDTIELTHPRIRVRRMSFGTDHETAYVAASGVYQEGVLALWTNLTSYVDQLNAKRRVTVVREF
ncbi:MAG TPA: hypothetical protein VMY42_21225 [Thermoguttaceae bacterium]|nr:hypothetical protein [Thermoguttaceae bacterium]